MIGSSIFELGMLQQGFTLDWTFAVLFIVLEVTTLGAIYFFSEPSGTSGPLGLRNKHMRPFALGLVTMVTGVLMAFFYIGTVGLSMDLVQGLGITLVSLLIGITFGFSIFMKKYRKGRH